jgi:hypothetical protein
VWQLGENIVTVSLLVTQPKKSFLIDSGAMRLFPFFFPFILYCSRAMATSDPQTKPSVSSSQTVTCSESSSVSSNNLTRTGTVFYSLDNNDSAGDNNNNNNNKKKRPQFETSENDEDTVESDHTVELKRKQSKIGHHTEEYTAPKKKTEPVTPSTPSPTTSQQQPGSSATELDIPDWHNNYKAWAFLQSQNPAYKSMYLVKRDNMEEGRRSGYVLGRKADCDIVYL